MALFNEILQGRYNQLLHQLLNMKEGAPAPQLASDVQAVLQLEGPPEYRFLANDRLGQSVLSMSGAAAVNSRVRARLNTPGVLLVMERMVVSCTGASDIQLFRSAAATDLADATAGGWFRDQRWDKTNLNTAGDVLTVSGENTTTNTNGSVVHTVKMLASTPYVYDVPHILVNPANLNPSLEWRAGTVNIGISVNFIYRFRAIEPSEIR